jgi:hypothetical protein
MSLLTIVNRAQAMLNLPVTSTVYSNTGETQRQLLALCNMAGDVLMREHDWQALVTEQSFTTVATEQQTGHTIPSDLDRVISETLWNRSTTDPVFGPLTAQSWQAQKADVVSTVWSQYRIRGNSFWFLPAPAAGQSIYYEYVSNKWCQSAGGTAQSAWAADSDTGRLSEHLLTLALAWRWMEAKGLDYSQRYEEYEREKGKIIARDGTRKKLNVTGPTLQGLGRGRIPEGSWN